ncbi:MAG: hypothetical protein WCQ80_02565 [Bacilli bacterium]
MKKSKFPIKKLILLAICILIPILSGYFIATYAYNRYQPYYFGEYMDNAAEDTESKLEAYLKYYTYSYDETPYYEQIVTEDDVHAMTFRIYRAIFTSQKIDNNYEVYTSYDLSYIFVLYDINYEKLIDIQDPTGEATLEYDNLPNIYINIQDKEFDGNSVTLTMGVPQDMILIQDYDSSPETDDRGEELNSRYLKWSQTQIDPDFSDNIEVEVYMTDSLSDEDASYHSTILTVTTTDFYQAFSQIDDASYIKGAAEDNEAAGYLAHVVKTKLWWQCLITVVLMGLVSLSFYVVWNAEETQQATKKESKR